MSLETFRLNKFLAYLLKSLAKKYSVNNLKMRNTQIAICCALALNLVLIMLVATGTWEFKYKKGCDPECGFEGPPGDQIPSK